RRPPCATLFPYTTLFRSVLQLARRLAPEVDRRIPADDLNRAVDEVVDEVFGLGPLEALLHDPTVTEVLVNAPDQVYVERHGRLRSEEHTSELQSPYDLVC